MQAALKSLKEEIQEVIVSLAEAKEISEDAAVVAVLLEMDAVFHFRRRLKCSIEGFCFSLD